MRILKFGGTSVADARRIRRVASIIRTAQNEDRVVVVVSALAGITDQLVELTEAVADGRPTWRNLLSRIRHRHLDCLKRVAQPAETGALEHEVSRRINDIEILCSGIELVGRPTSEVRERLLAAGERLSAPIVAAALRALNLEAVAVDGVELIRVTEAGGEVAVDLATTADRVREWLGSVGPTVVPVVTGFVAGDAAGQTRTLGRGGSDLSASVLGCAAGATRVEIWTDVNGVLTAPPLQVSDARTLSRLSYEEASEMAFFGAAVLHRDTLAPVADLGIPVWVRNTLAPEEEGTIVSAFGARRAGATAIASVESTTILTISGANRFHNPQASHTLGALVAGLQPEALITSQASYDQSLTTVIPESHAQRLDDLVQSLLDGNGAGLEYRKKHGTCLIAVIGHDLQSQPRVASQALETLDRSGLAEHLVATAASRHSISFVLEAEVLERALSALHESLFHTTHPAEKESPHVSAKEGRRARRYRQRRPAARSSVA